MDDTTKMKRHSAIGVVLVAVGGGLVAAGMGALLGWPGVAITLGLIMFSGGLWAAMMATEALVWLERANQP